MPETRTQIGLYTSDIALIDKIYSVMQKQYQQSGHWLSRPDTLSGRVEHLLGLLWQIIAPSGDVEHPSAPAPAEEPRPMRKVRLTKTGKGRIGPARRRRKR